MKAAGRTLRPKSFLITTTKTVDSVEYKWLPRTWYEEWPEFIGRRAEINEYRRRRIEETRVSFVDTIALKEKQEEVMSEMRQCHGILSGCLALHTGFGKTVVALKLISQLGVRCLWLSHTNQLLAQLQERARSFLGVDVGELDSDSNAPIVTCTIQSLLRKDFDVSSFGLLIIDEVHHMSAPSFSQAFHKIGGIPYTIGLSATLERKDGLEHVFQSTLGRVLSVRVLECTRKPLVRVLQGFWNFDIKLNRAGDPLFAQAITDMTRIEDYNRVIIEEIVRVYTSDPERKILLLTDRKEHILILNALLQNTPEIQKVDVGQIHGDLSFTEIQETLQGNKRIIMATYGLAGEGFDCPGLNCVLMATPRNDIRQAVGRILGERVGVLQPLIVDIRNTLGIFYNQGRERLKYYQEQEFDVEIIKHAREQQQQQQQKEEVEEHGECGGGWVD
jgi:superfamily II DNA or RNA helicase